MVIKLWAAVAVVVGPAASKAGGHGKGHDNGKGDQRQNRRGRISAESRPEGFGTLQSTTKLAPSPRSRGVNRSSHHRRAHRGANRVRQLHGFPGDGDGGAHPKGWSAQLEHSETVDRKRRYKRQRCRFDS